MRRAVGASIRAAARSAGNILLGLLAVALAAAAMVMLADVQQAPPLFKAAAEVTP